MAALKLTKSSAKRLLNGNEPKTLGHWEEKVEELEKDKSSLLDIIQAYKGAHDRLIKMNKKLDSELNRTKDQLQTTNQDMMRLQKKHE